MKFELILLLILIYLYFYFCYELFSNSENNIEIVIARYNESLEWLKDKPFNKYPVICYNSGKNNDFYKSDNMKIINIENIGKEAYVYLYHIVLSYNNLADLTIFLPGSIISAHKFNMAKEQIYLVEKHKNTVFLSSKFDNIRDDLYDFQLDHWCSTSNENIKKNAECKLNLSEIRPFGKWYDHHFNNIHTQYINFLGILGISKKHILNHPKEYYENLLKEFKHPNDEVAHYFERSWQAIFYPMNDAVFIKWLFDKF
jgi:hypothetical protein